MESELIKEAWLIANHNIVMHDKGFTLLNDDEWQQYMKAWHAYEGYCLTGFIRDPDLRKRTDGCKTDLTFALFIGEPLETLLRSESRIEPYEV